MSALVLFSWRSVGVVTRMCVAAAALFAAAQDAIAADESAGQTQVSYQGEVLPLLRARCQGCHQPARSEGDVDLTAARGWLGEASTGRAIVAPGDAAASELIAQITPDAAGVALMPHEGTPLSAAERELMRRWIAEGAHVDAAPRSSFDAHHPPRYARPATISALDASPDGRLLAVSGVHETLLLDAQAALRGERVIVQRLIGLAERIEAVRFAPDGGRLAVVGGAPALAGELQIWDVASGALLLSHAATDDVLRGVAWSPDGMRVAFGGANSTAYVVDATTGERIVEQGAHADMVTGTVLTADGKSLVTASRDQTLKLTAVADGQFIDNITAVSPGVPGGPVFALARHPRLDLVAAGGAEGVPRTYMIHRQVERKIGDDSNLVRAYPALGGRITAVAFSPDGRRLAAAGSDGQQGRLQLFAVPEAMEPTEDVRLIQGKVSTERTPAEAARLAEYHREGAVRLAAVAGRMGPVYAVAFAGDGKAVFSGGAEGVLCVHDAVHGTLAAELTPFPLEAGEQKRVEQASALAATEFITDVMPVLAKVGCNSGTCHGAREGQNGFALSLRGYDPLADFRALSDELSGRRINRADPAASLMLMKASGAVPHGGGVVLPPGSQRYETVRAWIAAGARYSPAAPRVTGIEIAPQDPVVQAPGETVSIRVTARYPGGRTRDVTADAFIESGDTETATVNADGVVTAVRRGEAPILARYEGAYAATTLTIMGDRTGLEWVQQPVYSPIDELVDAKLRRLQITASGLATDEQFLRRVHLDLTGLPPTADDVRAFLADPRASRDKRAAVIDALVGSDDFIEHWTNQWADLLLVNSKFLGAEGATAYRAWIRNAVAENWPYDRLVRELFTSVGSTREHPAGSYLKTLRTPDKIAETATQAFLGVRFNCNRCHDHPFERWTQDDYYSWAAYFREVALTKDPVSGDRTVAGSAVEDARPLYEVLSDAPGGTLLHLRTGQPVAARFPYVAETRESDGPRALRAQAAAWLTSPDNRYFASSFVNRVWAQLTGVGLIEPVDDIRAGNPPTNPALLEWLTREFIAHEFDVRWLIRTICQSRTYQLAPETNRWNEDDRRNYAHALPRRLAAEVLYDAVHRVVGSRSNLPGAAAGTRAAAIADVKLDLEDGLFAQLGSPARETGCACERTSELQLGPVMALVNGPAFAAAINDPESELARLESTTADDAALADEVFLRVLGRRATEAQRAAAVEALRSLHDDRDTVAAALVARTAELDRGFAAWRTANRPVAWTPLEAVATTATCEATFEPQDDGSTLVTRARGKGTLCATGTVALATIRGLRLEALADERLPKGGPGRASNGNFVLSHVRVLVDRGDGSPPRRVKLRGSEADFSQDDYPVSGAIDAKPATGWAIDGGIGQSHTAAFELSRAITLPPGARLVVELDHQHDDEHHLGRFRLAATADKGRLLPPEHPARWSKLTAAEALSANEEQALRDYYLSLDAAYRELVRAQQLVANPRLAAVQDLAWALINSPAFLFNY